MSTWHNLAAAFNKFRLVFAEEYSPEAGFPRLAHQLTRVLESYQGVREQHLSGKATQSTCDLRLVTGCALRGNGSCHGGLCHGGWVPLPSGWVS